MSTIEDRVNDYRKAVSDYDIFDAALWWAPQYEDAFVHHENWEEQLKAHAKFGINGGLVTAYTAAKYDPYIGNEEMMILLEGHQNFYGCAVVTPDMFFNPKSGRKYLTELKKRHVVAVRIYPGKYRHSMQEFAIGHLCNALEDMGMPLFVWHIDTGWDDMDRILTRHPRLSMVLESMDRKLLYHARDYISLLLAHENFYVETHNLVQFNEYETLNKLVGSGKLLYGSYHPFMTPDFSLYPVFAADIPDACKREIFAGTAKKLFGIK